MTVSVLGELFLLAVQADRLVFLGWLSNEDEFLC